MEPGDLDFESDESSVERQLLATLWEQARPAVFAYLTASVYDFHRAEDLLQEVAVAIAGRFQAYDAKRPFLAWSLGVARNCVLSYYREQARDRRHFSEATLHLLGEAAERHSPDAGSLKRDALRHCLGKIAGRRRQVLEMRYNGGLSIADIAAQIGGTSNAVKVLLHRVRNTLEECIQRRLAQERNAW
jgi:RNA polymerase sigma-70 factor (ECF subfamily)